MASGKIKKIIRDRGFGFINAEDGREIFFHQSGITSGNFDTITEGAAVEFEVEKSPKGPRAINIKVL